MRKVPNAESSILAKAIVGGVGLTPPPKIDVPAGMATVVLFVPMSEIAGKTPIELQANLGLPWYFHGGDPVWLDELVKSGQ